MALFVVAYPELSESDKRFISKFRAKHNWQFEIIEPHITLIFPTNNIGREQLCDHVTEVVSQFPPTKISFKAVKVVYGEFEKLWYLFLVPHVGYDYIVRLHDALYSGIMAGELRTDIRFIPHLTIGIFDNEDEAKRLCEEMGGKNINIRTEISAIDIVNDVFGEGEQIRGTKTIKQVSLQYE